MTEALQASIDRRLERTPPQVLARWGHTTPNLALAIYAAEVDRDDGEPERPRALVEGRDLPYSGSHWARDARRRHPSAGT